MFVRIWGSPVLFGLPTELNRVVCLVENIDKITMPDFEYYTTKCT